MKLAWLVAAALAALPVRQGCAEPFIPGAALDQGLVSEVTAAGLAFMAPRTLEAIPLPQLSLWGLRGLATLDPRLAPELRGGELRLLLLAGPQPHLLLARQLPQPAAEPAAWGDALGALVRAGWDASQPVRRVGTNGVLEVFFDEICNHLDAYSRYATPGEAFPGRDLRAGVGFEPVARRGFVAVGAVVPDGPAAMAGIRTGEALLAIDGQALAGVPAEDIADMLAGPEDSTVTLRLRGRGGRSRDVTLTRAVLIPVSVHPTWSGRLLVLQLTGFAADTAEQLAQALAEGAGGVRGRKAPHGVVIDLRGNRGGLLREAVGAAESLLEDGIVAATTGRDPAANHVFRADGRDLARGLPVVVLVDGSSASSAEILAAALADQRRAVVVGSSTVGKGLVQAVDRLPNGGELILTWSRVLAPLGWPIQGLGVLPQVCTSLGADATAAQLAALERGQPPMAGPIARQRAARWPVASAETLALRAVCPADEGRDDDLVAARFLIEHANAYATALASVPGSPLSP